MSLSKFNNDLLEKFTEEITDLVFQYIMDNEELMDKYLDLISKNTRKTVNSQLGKAIKNKFGVDNIDDNGEIVKGNPKCVLIKTKYTKHKY